MKNQKKLNFLSIKTTMQAINIIEGLEPAPQGLTYTEAYIQSFQLLINTGVIWQLQGWYGRKAQYLIDLGHCEKSLDTDFRST